MKVDGKLIDYGGAQLHTIFLLSIFYVIGSELLVVQDTCITSVRADTDTYRLSAPIRAFCRYIGFADKAIAYRYRLIWYLISVHNQIA